MVFSQGAPFFMRVERRLPALWSLLGHSPAQETRWPAVSKRLMSMPISETSTSAERWLMPGMVISNSMAARKGGRNAKSFKPLNPAIKPILENSGADEERNMKWRLTIHEPVEVDF